MNQNVPVKVLGFLYWRKKKKLLKKHILVETFTSNSYEQIQ